MRSRLSSGFDVRSSQKERHRDGERRRWSYRIGALAGIELRVHATFAVLLAWIALGHLAQGHGLREAVAGIAFVGAVFAVVVLHELGHALAARRYGIGTRDIVLLPIGGVARLERMPKDPKQQLVVALAGPAVNAALVLVLFVALVLLGAPAVPPTLAVAGGPLLAKLLWINVALAVFNMIPAFPMDGGRVLRAILALRLRPLHATEIAATVGQALALLLGLVGLFGNPFLVFAALFVWVGAQEEAAHARIDAALSGKSVERAMVTDFEMVDAREAIGPATDRLARGFQDDLPVVAGTCFLGMVTREDAMRATMLQGRGDAPAVAFMHAVDSVGEADDLERAFDLMRASGTRTLAVVRGDVLVGLLPLQKVLDVLELGDLHGRAAA